MNEEFLYSFRSNLSNLLTSKFAPRVIDLKISAIDKFERNPKFLCRFISQQLQKRIPFRRVIRSAILKAQSFDIKGIKVQIAGRLNGAEIARTEWVREGKIPLHNLMADLDYYSLDALVILIFFIFSNFLFRVNIFFFRI